MATHTKKILLLFDRSAVTERLADPARLVTLMAKSADNCEMSWTCWEDLIFYVSSTEAVIAIRQTGENLSNFDVVYFRRAQLNVDLRLAVAIYLRKKSIPFIDKEAYQPTGSSSKLTQYFRFWENGLPLPETFYGLTATDLELITKRKLSFPLIVKALAGTRGMDNHLVNTDQQLHELINKKDSRYLVQRFIPNDRDYRILVMDGMPVMAIERTRQTNTHKNNTSQGASSQTIDITKLPKAVIADAITSTRILGRNVAGVDMVIDSSSGKHYLFEVNRSPQIENSTFELEKAKHLVDYLNRISRSDRNE